MSDPVTPVGEIRVVQDGDVYRIVDEHGRRYALSAVSDDGCFESENGMTATGWEYLTSFQRHEAERLAAVLRRLRSEVERVERVAAERDRALAMADDLARGLCVFEDACEAAKKWLSGRRDG